MPVGLDDSFYTALDARLAATDAALVRQYPGDTGSRQPVHTVYVPADRFTAATARQWGDAALALLDEQLADAAALAEVTGIPLTLAEAVYPLVRAKLQREPIEDLRIDFEDGYGSHTDADEDAEAERVAGQVQLALAAEAAPAFIGLRIRSLEQSARRRGLRTLDLVLGEVLAAGPLPAGFVVTLPKVTSVAQVEAFVEVCATLEGAYGLRDGQLRFEIQVETPQAVQSADGRSTVAAMVQAALGRVTGLHYGTYDYSAACGVSAGNQSLAHPVADHAKAVMQLAAAGTGVRISDGSTNVVPVGSPEQVRAAWALHATLVRRSLDRAYYQGWDLHPGQLVTRYAATYAFYRSGLPDAAARLRAYLDRTGSDAGVLDEPATAQAMAALLVRGVHSGALTSAEVRRITGVDADVIDDLYRRRGR